MNRVATPFLLLLTCTLLLVRPPVANAVTDRERDGLSGPVHTIVTEKVGVIDPAAPERDTLRQDDTRRVSWRLESLLFALPDLDPDLQLSSRILWRTVTYDAQGKRTGAAFYTDNGSPRWEWRYTYDAEGKRLARTSHDATGTLRWTWRYGYDTQGNLTEQTETNADGELTRRWQYTYDARGHLLEEINHDASGSLLWKWRYTYDASGRRMARTQYARHDTLVRRWQYTYDTSGNLLEETHYSAMGILMWEYHYAYNARGHVTEEQQYKADGSLLGRWRHTYDYDARGNWIKRTTAKWVTTAEGSFFEPAEITYRTLTYYGGE